LMILKSMEKFLFNLQEFRNYKKIKNYKSENFRFPKSVTGYF